MTYTLLTSGNLLTILPDAPLTANREYKITLLSPISGVYDSVGYTLSADYIFWFTSAYCPIFSTLTKVKLEAGPIADLVIDDTIYRMIHKNSLDAVDLYNIYHSSAIPYDYWGCTWHDVPFILRRYVECKTAYDLLSLLKLSGAGNLGTGGDQTKTLGDMTIKYGGDDGGNSGGGNGVDPKKMGDLYNCWQEAKRGIQAIRVAVKGYWDESKGFAHPVREVQHNRVIRAVNFSNACPSGPWENALYWRGVRHNGGRC
jgi:hypothetical protein